MSNKERSAEIALLKRIYTLFNKRKIDEILEVMHADVEWPNGMEGGYVYGHEGIRNYWTRQWTMINPLVDPVSFEEDSNRNMIVNVHQVVHDLNGNLLNDAMVQHIYFIKDGFIRRMEIHEP
jgi:hypothetical protein